MATAGDDPAAGGGPGDDAPADVEAAVATLRRSALAHAAVFLGVVLAVPALTVLLPWWSGARLLGGLSVNFVVAAAGLYLFFAVLGAAGAALAGATEERMLGQLDPFEPEARP